MSSCPDVLPSGVQITRRLTLHGSWALPAMWMLARLAPAQSPARGSGDVEEFLRRWTDKAAKLVGQSEPNEDAHVYGLCSELARLDPGAFPPRQKVVYDDKGIRSGPAFVAMPLLVIQFDLEPGAVIPAHNHVGFDFVSMGVRGEATVRHFEPHGKAPDPTELDVDFQIREVSSCVLYPGRTSSLSRTRANIHWFQAGENGATFLDFGIKFPDPGPGPKTASSLEFDDEPLDRKRRVHNARWLGNIYAKK